MRVPMYRAASDMLAALNPSSCTRVLTCVMANSRSKLTGQGCHSGVAPAMKQRNLIASRSSTQASTASLLPSGQHQFLPSSYDCHPPQAQMVLCDTGYQGTCSRAQAAVAISPSKAAAKAVSSPADGILTYIYIYIYRLGLSHCQ